MESASVIVATYRRDAELNRALESLANQTCVNIDIVLVDDNGDTEWNGRVASIVESFRVKHPNVSINYIANSENQGAAKTRNIGVLAAKCEYITFLDDDDVYLPNKIRSQVEFMESGRCDYCITDLVLYNEKDKAIDKRTRDYIKDTGAEALKMYHLKYHMTGTDTMMFRKDYFMKIGGFAAKAFGEDYYLIQKAIEGGGKFGYLHGCEIKAYVHTGENGLSSGKSKIDGENDLYEYKKTLFKSVRPSTRRYIRMRHYAVLAFAYMRMDAKFKFIKFGFLSFLCAPIACIRLVIKRKV